MVAREIVRAAGRFTLPSALVLAGLALALGAADARAEDAQATVATRAASDSRAVASGARIVDAVNTPQVREARPLGFSAKAEPSQVGLGRPFVYEIEVRHAPADRYELPKPLALGEATVRKVESSREAEGEVAVTRFRIEAALFDRLGEAALPEVVLTVRGPEGPRELRIPGAPVTVTSTAKGDDLAGMHAPQELRVPSYRVVWIALGVLVAVALGALAWRRWRARGPAEKAPAPPRPAEDVALEALAALEAEALARAGRTREHYFRLSTIVRSFIEGSGGPEALERTSAELVKALREAPLAGLETRAFASWLERGDLVRYAGLSVAPEASSADLGEAREFVRRVAEAKRVAATHAGATTSQAAPATTGRKSPAAGPAVSGPAAVTAAPSADGSGALRAEVVVDPVRERGKGEQR